MTFLSAGHLTTSQVPTLSRHSSSVLMVSFHLGQSRHRLALWYVGSTPSVLTTFAIIAYSIPPRFACSSSSSVDSALGRVGVGIPCGKCGPFFLPSTVPSPHCNLLTYSDGFLCLLVHSSITS